MGLRGPGAKPIPKSTDTSVDQESPSYPWQADGLSLAERVMVFCESLPVTSGRFAGTQWRARPWQRRFIERLYLTDDAGRRVVRTAVLSMGRKNGKSDLAVRLLLAHICGPCSEARGEVYCCANDRFQASRLFHEMCAVIQRVAWMEARISIKRHAKELEDIGGTGTIFAALSADVSTKHGLSTSMFCYDEMGQSTSRDLFDVMDTSLGARENPLGLIISTQSARDDMPLSELIDYGQRVEAGEVEDPSFILELHTADPVLDPFSSEAMQAANPGLGDIRDADDLQRLADQARRMPSRQASFENLCLNRRVDTVQQFITAAVWKACGAAVDVEALAGRECFGGLDLSSSRDMTSLALAFPDEDGSVDLLSFNWMPGDLHERENEDRAPYPLWRKNGYLEPSTGETVDPRVVAAKLAELSRLYSIRAIAADRWKLDQLQRELDDIACSVPVIPHGQGWKDMNGAVNALEAACFERRLRHGGNPVLTMAMSNLKIAADPANNRKPEKRRSTGRIDPAVAAMMALNAINLAPPLPTLSIYESRGVLAVASNAIN